MIISNLQEFCTNLIKGSPIIAIDYGKRKIGTAISNQELTFAMPFKSFEAKNEAQQIHYIIDLLKTRSFCAVVIGLPVAMDGRPTAQTQLVEAFSLTLSKSTTLPIYYQDERCTSKAADNLLKLAGMKRKDRNACDDNVAACIILQDLLNKIINIANFS